MEALKNTKSRRPDPKVMQQKEAEQATREEQRAKERSREDAEDDAWDPDEARPWEVPMYFKKPQQLLDIFAALEERNLFLIQNSQETEEQLEELKQKLEVTRAKMDEETEQLQAQINSLKQNISLEEAKASALRERANPHKGQADEHDIEVLLLQLNKRVGEVYEKCAFEPDSSLGTLMMLANIEAKLEEHLGNIEKMPQEEVCIPMRMHVGVCVLNCGGKCSACLCCLRACAGMCSYGKRCRRLVHLSISQFCYESTHTGPDLMCRVRECP